MSRMRFLKYPEVPYANMETAATNIDRLLQIALHIGNPRSTEKLREAAVKKIGKPLVFAAAKRLIDTVKPGDVVIISTGWVVPPDLGIDWLPAGENDGPSGSTALAYAIARGLDAKVVFIQEETLIPALEATCKASSIRTFPIDDLKRMPGGTKEVGLNRASILGFPVDLNEAKKTADNLLADLEPAAIISVEKCGRNSVGVYHSGQGNDISASTAKVDILFDQARSQGITTIGMGDLGNEIGFGLIKDAVKEFAQFGEKCECPCGQGVATEVETDVLVIGDCSNSIPLGVAAILSGLLRDPDLLQDADTFRRSLEAGVQAGTLCGGRMIPSLSVHGIHVDVHIHVLELMRAIIDYEFINVYGRSRFLRTLSN